MEPGGKTSTFDLAARAKSGDQEAFRLLFERSRRRLAVLVHYRMSPSLRARMEADDVLQEVYLAAWRDLDRFHWRSPGSFLRWLSAIASHVLADLARYENRDKRDAARLTRFRSVSNPGGAEPADTDTPSRIYTRAERLRQLFARLDELPEDYRNAIVMAKVEGLDTAEMAARLGRSREAAALLLHRALARFRQSATP